MHPLLALRIVASFALTGLLGHARAATLSIPLRLDQAVVRQVLAEQVYTEANESVRVWDDGQGCNFLTLSEPQVEATGGRLRVLSRGLAQVGTALGGHCLGLVRWKGYVEAFEAASIDPGAPVIRFRVVDSNIYGEHGKKGLASGTLWDWVKRYVHPRLEAVRIDLYPALAEVREVLPLMLARNPSTQPQGTPPSLRLSTVDIDAGWMTAGLSLETPAPAVAVPGPQPPLTAEEPARWDTLWQQWDAFLGFVLKTAAADTPHADLRVALLGVLLEARYDLLEALSSDAPRERDPVRKLFLKTWTRLAPVMRRLEGETPGQRALHYASFIAAGDALNALDALGPGFGLEISADGLRRLARIMAPASAADPLRYSEDLDPELRERFGFGPPLTLPSGMSPAPAGGAVLPRSSLGAPTRGHTRWYDWPLRSAWAAPEQGAASLSERLNGWAPSKSDLGAYLPLVRELLQQSVHSGLDGARLDARFRPVFRVLVLTTAWQETCWKQFVKQGSEVRPVLSAAGSVGIMQINQKVWRGFYDLRGLRQDIGYNARAGNEILLHYLRDYAIAKGEDKITGSVDNLARATYAVYNGGPGQLRRYRQPPKSRLLRRIDADFWSKYQQVKAGNEMAVAQCYGS